MTEIAAIKKTRQRVLTRRGVLWLGQTCNLRCRFCYFSDRIRSKGHEEHDFMSLEKAKKICHVLLSTYGNTSIDIQGGEPTLYPEIHELVKYCRDIGLAPTLITNAVLLSRLSACQKLKDAGIRDLLISVHGLGHTYDHISGVPNSHQKQMAALKNLQEVGIPFRFNCVLAKSVLPDLEDVAKLAIDMGARVMNFIAFNPFEDQQQKRRSMDDVPSYTEVSVSLIRALDSLIEAGVECNVRYYPLCMVARGYRKYIYNFQQLPYDVHEWDYASWSWSGQKSQRMREGALSSPVSLREANTWSKLFADRETYMTAHITEKEAYRHSAWIRAQEHCCYQYAAECKRCSLKKICDGFHGDYASMFSTNEAEPVLLNKSIDDPLFYVKNQDKIVEKGDWNWAMGGKKP